MSESATEQSIQDRILAQAGRGEAEAIEEAWLELVPTPPVEPEFYKQLVKCFKRADKLDSALELFHLTFEELANQSQWKTLDRLISTVAPAWPKSDELRKRAVVALRSRYVKLAEIEPMLGGSGIKGDAPLDQAIRKFREYLRLIPGQVYGHVSWGEGIVSELDVAAGKVTFDFKNEKGKKLTLEGVKNYLTYLPPSHFLARRTKDLKQLQSMAEDDPAGLVKLALESSGGKLKQADFKAMMIGSVITEAHWTSWWTRARQEIRLDPMIDLDASGGARALIALREKPRTFAEEIEGLFFAADADFSARAAAVQKLSNPQNASAVSTDLLKRMIDRLEKDFRVAGDEDPMRTLGIAFLLEDLKGLDSALKHHISPIPESGELLKNVHDYSSLTSLEHIDHAVRGLHHLLARDGSDGAQRAAHLLPKAPVKLAQAIWKEFDLEHHRAMAAEAIETVLASPLDNPETYIWAARMIIEGNWSHLDDHFSLSGTVMDLIETIEEWHEIAEDPSSGKAVAAAAQQLVGRVKTILSARNYAAICAAAEAMTLEQAQRLRQSLQKNAAFNAPFKSTASRQLLLTRKDLDTPLTGEARKPVDAGLHLCTAKTRRLKTLELRELTGVKIPANSKAIDEARQEGDLKENAGYHAAKDEQKILMQHMMALQESLGAAQVIHADSVRTDVISFGTKFSAVNRTTGQEESHTILGKWEADPENHVMSIQAPFAQQFLGKKVGDAFEVMLPVGGKVPYRVTAIENALATGDWDEESEEVSTTGE